MKPSVQVLLITLGFDFYWTLVVLFRQQGEVLWLALALAACLMLPPVYRFYSLLLAAAGSLVDALWVMTGLIEFSGSKLLPLWMLALWLMFASVWIQISRITSLPGWLLAGLATLGGPMAYLAGEYLGAMTFLQPTLTVIGWMALGWLTLMLYFHILIRKIP